MKGIRAEKPLRERSVITSHAVGVWRLFDRFLCASTRTVFAWPLAKERRRHIHGMLDSHNLPVTHSTKRCGSPFILVLTKQKALFQRAAAERKQQQTLLSWLRKERRAFVNDTLFSAVHV